MIDRELWKPAMMVYQARLIFMEAFAPYLDRLMQRHVGQNWLDIARNSRAPDAAPSCLDEAQSVSDLDDYTLFRIALAYWPNVFQKDGLKPTHRSQLSNVLHARNTSAHPNLNPLKADVARTYLVAMDQFLIAIAATKGAQAIRDLKESLSTKSETPDFEKVVNFELVEKRILDQISAEFENRSTSSQKAGRALLETLEVQNSLLREIRELVSDPGKTNSENVQPIISPSLQSAWEVRENLNGSISAWMVTRSGAPLKRLVLSANEFKRIFGNLAHQDLRDKRGAWVKIQNEESELLEAEFKRRIA